MRYDFAHTDTISDEGGVRWDATEMATHYSSVNRSEVPQGRKGKHRKAVADILADLPKLNAQQAIKVPLEQSERREDAESSLCLEPRDAREKHPRGNVERREIPVRLARRLIQEYRGSRIAGGCTQEAKRGETRSGSSFKPRACSIVQNDVE